MTRDHDAAGRLTRIDHGNGTAVVRQYDAADRPTLIRHEDAGGNAMLELAYTYSADGLVTRIIETDEVSEGQGLGTGGQPFPPLISQVDFEYDNRNRLTHETREALNNVFDTDLGPAEYDLSYTYDLGGNRLTKENHRSGVVTTYHYDITEAGDGGQHNNRLLSYDVSGPIVVGSTGPMLEQTVYTYGPAGNVTRLVKRLDMDGDGLIDANDILAAVWWFYYDTSNRLWLVVRGTGDYDESFATLSNTVFDKAAEHRYDGGRQRYLVRERNPNPDDPELPEDPNTNPRWTILGTDQWRDYAGEGIYNDYTVNQAGTVTNGTTYIPGIGIDDPSLAHMPAYYGSDLIGTTRRVVDSSMGGTGVSPVVNRTVLTAFGEPISSASTSNTRYGYAGAFGYESPEQSFDPLTELGWLHVGARYYDPAVGRFVQRDPIGIRGGLNTYTYVMNSPLTLVDPSGQTVLPNQPPGGIRVPVRTQYRATPNTPARLPPVIPDSPFDKMARALGKVYCIAGTPAMFGGSLIADLVTTIFISPMQWVGLVPGSAYQPGDITKDVGKGIRETLKDDGH